MEFHQIQAQIKCDKCEKLFQRKSLLKLHARSHVLKEERIVFSCHTRHKRFSSKSAVSAQLKTSYLRERPFVCERGGHSFTSRGILQGHLTIHSDEAPWNCSKCNKNFKTKYRLEIHMNAHQDTKRCIQTQTMFNTLCIEELDEHATLLRDGYLSENKEEMRDNEKVRYKNNKFKDSNYECFENENYEMVRIEPEYVTKTRSRKGKVVAECFKKKVRSRMS